jgi:hypothetical protein
MRALGAFGPDAKEAVPALRKDKLDSNKEIREAATAALASIEKADK